MTATELYNMQDFYRHKRVLITGHTGFKGMWLTKMLQMMGAQVTGFSLQSSVEEGRKVFPEVTGKDIYTVYGDIRNLSALDETFTTTAPEIVFHLAAQPLVLVSYENPVYTYDVNVMGTINFMECVRRSESVRSCVVITTDKVYHNKEWAWGYRENDRLNGKDPYSNSKSCAELAVSCYKKSFFQDRDIAASTMRAGNVIGGGDFSKDRIIPDCVRAAMKGERVHVRNPQSLRPYQHVLEALSAYLLIAFRQYEEPHLAGSYNIGPREQDALTTGEIAEMFCRAWGEGLEWYSDGEGGADGKEARLLWLDCTKIKSVFGWQPVWEARTAVEKTADWFKGYAAGVDLQRLTEQQIEEYWKGGMANG